MGTSVYVQNQVLNNILRGSAGTPPSAWYLALFSDDPMDSLTNELAFDDYARVAVTFVAALGGVCRLSADANFGTTANDWGDVAYYAVFDSLTSGNLLVSGSLDVVESFLAGDQVIIGAGDLAVTLE